MIAPGALCMSHESIYRPGGCKVCHSKTKKIDNDKCLSCHNQIMEKIRKNAGLHARVTQRCSSCHREHNGRYNDLIQLDVKTFDHNMTGYPLEGKHAILKCIKCHSTGSYLLYKTECIDCHEDIHEGKNGIDCLECHNQNTFEME